jgi:hypothetical protein
MGLVYRLLVFNVPFEIKEGFMPYILASVIAFLLFALSGMTVGYIFAAYLINV